MEYTKGKWKYTRPQIGTSNGVICTMVEPHYMPDCGDTTWYNGCVETMEANANLIAASKDMYEALKLARDALTIKLNSPTLSDAFKFHQETEPAILRALSKAEGK